MKQNVNIGVAVDYTGKNAINKIKSDLGSLGDTARKLAGAFALEQVVTRSLDAFKQETTAVTGLSVALGNLGISLDSLQPVIDKQVSNFADLGFTGSQTIDAITKLTTALGNPAKALDVLGTTADLARYKNQDLVTTATQVAKAVAGNSRAFADLGLKIDKTLTPQNAFNKLIQQAQAKAGGLATAYSQTAAGAMDVFAAKTENASAKLGQDLAPAIAQVATFADTYIIPVVDFLTSHTDALLATATAISAIAGEMKILGGEAAAGTEAVGSFFAPILAVAGIGQKAIKGLIESFKQTFAGAVSHIAGQAGAIDNVQNALVKPVDKKIKATSSLQSAEKILAGLEKAWQTSSLSNQKAITAQQQKQLDLQRAKLSLQLAGQTADLQNIEIQAALQRGQTAQITDVLLLQRALLNGNADQANILAQEVLKANGLVMDVNGNISSLASAKDPFADWPSATKAALDEIAKIQAALDALRAQQNLVNLMNSYGPTAQYPAGFDVTTGKPITTAAGAASDAALAAADAAALDALYGDGSSDTSSSGVNLPPTAVGTASSINNANPYSSPTYSSANPIAVTVMLNGQAVGNAITNAQVDQSASGINPTFQRSGYGTGALPW